MFYVNPDTQSAIISYKKANFVKLRDAMIKEREEVEKLNDEQYRDIQRERFGEDELE